MPSFQVLAAVPTHSPFNSSGLRSKRACAETGKSMGVDDPT